MTDMIEARFYHYLQVAGDDKIAAAVLTLAEVLKDRPIPPAGQPAFLQPQPPVPPRPWEYSCENMPCSTTFGGEMIPEAKVALSEWPDGMIKR